ncbi:MAG: tetratricopeptide repeat protein [Candidatus Brocadia sp.]
MKKAYQNKLYSRSITISIIAILTIITYLNCLPNQFVYDDTSTIVENRFIKDWGNFQHLFTHDYFKYSGELTYRPLVTLSYFIDYALWHMDPMGYHVVNVMLHTLNVMLMYFFVLLLFRQYDRYKTLYSHDKPSPLSQENKREAYQQTFQSGLTQGNNTRKGKLSQTTRTYIDRIPHTCLALLTCILFAVHPVVSEVVNVISYREDLIATAFLTTSFVLYLLYQERGSARISLCSTLQNGDSGGFPLSGPFHTGAVSLYAGAMATYFFALLSKESALALPALIFSFDLLFSASIRENGHSSPVFAIYKTVSKIIRSPFFLGYIGISLVYLIIRFFIFHNPQEKIAYPEGSFFVNMLTMTKVLGRYIANIFLPLNLNADYHVLYLKTPLTLSFIIPFFALFSLVIIAIRLRRKRYFYRVMIFATLWFFISVLPVLNIIPLANIMADRYLYLPILGFCLFFSITLLQLKISIIKHSVIGSLIIFYIVVTVNRNNVWRDEFTLWYNSSQSPSCSFTTYNNLGTQYNKKGYPDAALICYQKAIQKAREVGFTHYATVYYNMGNAYEKKDLLQQAVSAYKKAIQMKPDYQQAHNNLGKVYFVLNRYDDAIAEYNNAIAIDPNFAYAYNNLGVLYNKLGRQEEALAAYKKALSLDPQYGDAYYNLGNIYEARRQYDLALEAYQTALKLNPAQVYVHNNLGTIYDKKGRLEDAIAEYRHAIRLDSVYPYSYNNLGASLIKKGDREGALAAFQKAVDLLPDQPDFHFNMGYAHLQEGSLENALKEFETTLKLAPSHTEALFCMGTIYYKLGEKEKAIKLWQAVLGLNPNHEKAKKYIDDLR